MEQLSECDKGLKNKRKYAQRMAFSKFVDSKCLRSSSSKPASWNCCTNIFNSLKDFHKHVAHHHSNEVADLAGDIVSKGSTDARWSVLKSRKLDCSAVANQPASSNQVTALARVFSDGDVFPWLPKNLQSEDTSAVDDDGQILLFYKYRDIEDTTHVSNWQKALCERLNLSGKVRVAPEGLNVTVGGSLKATEKYIEAVRNHPWFCDMELADFKKSKGGSDAFSNRLKVGVYAEAVPMGIAPNQAPFKEAGKHLTPEEFHTLMEKLEKNENNVRNETVLVDCRNFYEARIGHFKGAITPDIRKFSYWPEYVDQNKDLFQDKKVYMYCTGGIRCERGSAYLKSKGITKEVFQLEGGIHKYIEKYPNGYFSGKLFVFDDRYSIPANGEVISACSYCGSSWDEYQPCSSELCHQLVLSCDQCRSTGKTACCVTCQANGNSYEKKEQCDCTQRRNRIPIESVPKTS